MEFIYNNELNFSFPFKQLKNSPAEVNLSSDTNHLTGQCEFDIPLFFFFLSVKFFIFYFFSSHKISILSKNLPVRLAIVESGSVCKSNLIKMHKALEVRMDNKSKGRGIHIKEESKNNLIEDNSLLVEIPFITWLDPFECANYCSNCFKKLGADRLKCKKCKAINYCSVECLKAFNEEHKFECENLNILSKFGILQMAVRVLMKEANLIENVSELISANTEEKVENSKNSNNPNDSIEHSSEKNLSVKLDENHNLKETNQLKSSIDKHRILDSKEDPNLINFYSLDGHIHSNSFTILICLSLASIFTSKFLHLIYEFEDSEFSISVRLFRIALILRQNTMETYDELKNLPIGHAIYLFSSLFNHACRPNCVRYFTGNQIKIVQKATLIPANNELTITYGLDQNLAYKDRRKQLKERFDFECLCADCCNESANDLDCICKRTDCENECTKKISS